MKSLVTILCSYIMIFSQNAQYQSDISSIENLSKAYYETLSGPIGKKRDWNRLKNLFHQDARLVYSSFDKSSKKNNLLQMTVDDYIAKLGYTEKLGFYEEEYLSITEGFSSVFQVWNSYHFKTADEKIKGQGITSYQIVFDGNEYKILSMLWCLEDERDKIPKKYIRK